MHIGIVGGASKNYARYEAIATASECSVEFHDGYMTSTATQALEGLVARSNVVIVVTRINSHRAVLLTRQLARRHERTLLIVRRFGLRHLRSLVCASGDRTFHLAA